MLLHDIKVPKIYHDNSLKHSLLDYTDSDKFDVILMNPPYGGHEDKSIQSFFPDDLASSETADLFMSVIMYRLKQHGRAAVVVPDGFLFGLDNAKVAIKKKLLTEFNLHTIIRLPSSVFAPYTPIATNLLFFDNTQPTKETWFYRVDMPSDRKHFSKTNPMELKHFDECIAWWKDRKEIVLDDGPKAQSFSVDYLLNEKGCNLDLCGYLHEEKEVLDPLDTIRIYQEKRSSLNAEIDHALSEMETLIAGESINSEQSEALAMRYVPSYGELAKLNAKFPEDMKKSILQYAIQGKLVEQRPEEGTAEELYRQIQTQKKQLMKDGKIKKEKPLAEITEDELPFDIPKSWKWVRFGEIYSLSNGIASRGTKGGTSRPVLRLADLSDGIVDVSNIRFIELSEKEFLSHKIEKDDLIFIRVNGTKARVATAFHYKEDETVSYCDHLFCGNKVSKDIFTDYIMYVFNAAFTRKQLLPKIKTTAGQNTISQASMAGIIIPLPPLAEQKRIVQKINQLLPYCHQLIK